MRGARELSGSSGERPPFEDLTVRGDKGTVLFVLFRLKMGDVLGSCLTQEGGGSRTREGERLMGEPLSPGGEAGGSLSQGSNTQRKLSQVQGNACVCGAIEGGTSHLTFSWT